ncbi:MAG: anaerobic ribonucleoside-triphosphate reductase, partial [Lachnospiraceae bacterium]
INSDMEPNDVRSMCCRLRLDLRELRKKSGGFFGSGESTGSVGVVTINLPRIAYLAKNERDFYQQLDRLMDIAARSLKIKREIITKLLNEGLYPYTKRYLGTFKNHFSTIGLVGMNEASLNANWIQCDLTTTTAQQFAKDVLNHMRERLSDYQEQYGDLYNLEATPAESTAYRLAKHDVEKYPNIITAGQKGDTPYYTNSSHLPVDYTADIFDALDIQDELQTLYTSGTVFHAFLGEKLPDWKAAATLVRKIAENYKLPYYTLSPTYSICTDHGYLSGEHFTCPKCGKPSEVYSRITGYYRPVQNWNEGKTQEYKNRKIYTTDQSTIEKIRSNVVTMSGNDITVKPAAGTKYLFTTKTCPNCKIAKDLLSNEYYELIDAEERPDLAAKFGIMQAPTLVVVQDNQTFKFVNASNIKKFIEQK